MQITSNGLKQLEIAAQFYADILLHPLTNPVTYLDIGMDKNLKVQGAIYVDDTHRRPKYFTIHLRGNEDDDPLEKTLAHEMVHLKQFSKGEVSEVWDKNSCSIFWNGTLWKPKRREHHYFDAPWEIEAFGREVGLYGRWLESFGT